MGLLKDISNAIKNVTKTAQAPGFIPTPSYYSSMQPKSMSDRTQKDWGLGGKMDSMYHSANASMLRGVAKGMKEAVPGFVDFTSGNIAGLVAGGIEKARGNKFSDGFYGAKGEVRRLTDAIRRGEMAIGGNAVRKGLDSVRDYHLGNVEKSLGQMYDSSGELTKDWKDYVKHLEGIQGIEDVSARATELAVTWPAYGKALKGLASIGNGGNTASKAGRLANMARRSTAGASIPVLGVSPSVANYMDSIENPVSVQQAEPAPAASHTPEEIEEAKRLFEQTKIGPWRDDARYEQASKAMDVIQPNWRDYAREQEEANSTPTLGWQSFL